MLRKAEEVLTCYHCGNKTVMKLIATYEDLKEEKITNNVLGSNFKYVISFKDKWELFLCQVCNNVTLKQKSSNSEDADHNGEMIVDEKILYPYRTSDVSNVPENVLSAYEAALKVRLIDSSICAIAIRRTLETMCKDKKAEGRDLYSMLSFLSSKGILPPILNEMATVLRKIGNAAAHADEKEDWGDLIPSLIDFTKIILDYVYNLPLQIENIQNRISNKPNKKPQVMVTFEDENN
ncbi:DUF4145 domain-containing protein [Niallia circulans]|uniref:DUF4145 domain-containing protein n=1 Tax=Niallia circulans TaxID=1397 RepID=UPI003D9991A0